MGMDTKLSDDFTAWNLYADADTGDEEGEIALRYAVASAPESWRFSIAGESGTIRQVFADDPTLWQVNCGNQRITARQVWRGDTTEWRITDNDGVTFTIKSRYSGDLNEWVVDHPVYGFMEVYTAYENDMREWVIVDDMSGEVCVGMKICAVFLAMDNSRP